VAQSRSASRSRSRNFAPKKLAAQVHLAIGPIIGQGQPHFNRRGKIVGLRRPDASPSGVVRFSGRPRSRSAGGHSPRRPFRAKGAAFASRPRRGTKARPVQHSQDVEPPDRLEVAGEEGSVPRVAGWARARWTIFSFPCGTRTTSPVPDRGLCGTCKSNGSWGSA